MVSETLFKRDDLQDAWSYGIADGIWQSNRVRIVDEGDHDRTPGYRATPQLAEKHRKHRENASGRDFSPAVGAAKKGLGLQPLRFSGARWPQYEALSAATTGPSQHSC